MGQDPDKTFGQLTRKSKNACSSVESKYSLNLRMSHLLILCNRQQGLKIINDKTSLSRSPRIRDKGS